MNFFAIDVETANPDMSSICSIGIAKFQDGIIIDEFYTLINPKSYFDEINVSIHGIDQDMVRGAPAYKDMSQKIHAMIFNSIVVTHTHFDRVAIQQSCDKFGLDVPACRWLDSSRIARRAWMECAQRDYGLANVCKLIGYKFKHHNALEDAKASGHVLLSAIQKTGIDLDGWFDRVRQPINPEHIGNSITRSGNSEGPLFGEVVAFTGALSMPRRVAADMAAVAGCSVEDGVTKKTTILVVGDVDIQRLAGHEKSSKHRKAEELLNKGSTIRIIRETDFCKLVSVI